MSSTETGNLEQDPSKLYPTISEEGSSEQQTAEFQRQQEEWRAELKSTEEDITTLRQLLDSKLRRSAELRRKLGLTPMAEIKHDLQEGLKAVRESPALQKTNQTLRGLGAVMSQKWTDLRNSQAVAKAGAAVTTAKDKMVRSTTFDYISSKVGGGTSNGAANGHPESNGEIHDEQASDAPQTTTSP